MSNKRTHEEFIEILKSKSNNIKVLGNYNNSTTNIKCECLVCGYIWDANPNKLLSEKHYCPLCNNRVVEKGINDIWTTNKNLANLLLDPENGYKYSQFSNKRVDWKCNNCSTIVKDKKIHDINIYGFSCPSCGDGISYPNKLMFNLLTQLKICFECEKSFDWCKFLHKGKTKCGRYDFYFKDINNNKYLVEMDGGFHFKDNTLSGQLKNDSIYIDNMKNSLAIKNGFDIIRIDSSKSNFSFIKSNIINSKLGMLFDLCNVDWNSIELNINQSEMISVCGLWNNGIKNIKDISNIMNRDTSTIRKYLKRGNLLGICDYSAVFRKKIFCEDLNIIFSSCSEAAKYFNMSITTMSLICRGKQNNINDHKLYYIL